MSRLHLLFLFLSFAIFLGKGQENNEILKNYIIWQPDLNIEYDDFELQADTSIVKQFKNLWISSSCKVKILVVMDIPKQNRRFSFKQEKVYIAPVFCKQLSCNIAKQPKTLEYAKLQLDLAEW